MKHRAQGTTGVSKCRLLGPHVHPQTFPPAQAGVSRRTRQVLSHWENEGQRLRPGWGGGGGEGSPWMWLLGVVVEQP